MTRYFFDLHECGVVSPDDDGIELPGLEEARQTALEAAREVMSAEIVEGRLCLGCHIEIRDESGVMALCMPFKDAVSITGL